VSALYFSSRGEASGLDDRGDLAGVGEGGRVRRARENASEAGVVSGGPARIDLMNLQPWAAVQPLWLDLDLVGSDRRRFFLYHLIIRVVQDDGVFDFTEGGQTNRSRRIPRA